MGAEPATSTTRTPVLLLIHRRPDLTARVFAAIRAARPATLLVAADGPADDPRCQECRALVLDGVDWPCAVETRLLEENAGCKLAVAGALDWAFSLHERVIVLEDDCLPHGSFFPFCDELLEHHAHTLEVMQICGSNLVNHEPRDGAGYFFSRFGPIWGWATWRRAWRHYDVEMRDWPAARAQGILRHEHAGLPERLWRGALLDAVHRGAIDTWDYQWSFAKMKARGLSIVPRHNLVTNLGFGPGATHTLDATDPRAGLPARAMDFPLAHPRAAMTDATADDLYLQNVVRLPRAALSPDGMIWMLRHFLRRAREMMR